jgi:hypothetical protein
MEVDAPGIGSPGGWGAQGAWGVGEGGRGGADLAWGADEGGGEEEGDGGDGEGLGFCGENHLVPFSVF